MGAYSGSTRTRRRFVKNASAHCTKTKDLRICLPKSVQFAVQPADALRPWRDLVHDQHEIAHC